MAMVIVELLVRSAVVLLAVEVSRRIPRSASQRHALLAAGFFLLLLLPAISLILPELHLVWHRQDSASRDGSVTIQQLFAWPAGAASHPTVIEWLGAVWLTGALMAAMPLVVAHVRLSRLKRGAVPLQLPVELLAQAGIKNAPRALIIPQDAMPMSCGWFRSELLLPENFPEWPASLRESVLLHELAHTRRRDVLVQEAARVIASLWWFQPFVWPALRALRAESEHACDEAVMRAGLRSSEYAASLLEIARAFGNTASRAYGSAAMAYSADVSSRIRRILEFRRAPALRRKIAAAFLVLVLSTAAAAAVDVPFTGPIPITGGIPSMKRLILLTLAGLSAQTFHTAAAVSASKQQEQQTPRAIRVKPELAESNLVHKVPPVYPAKAKSEGVQGTVVLDVSISKEGVPQDIEVLSSPSDDLTESATDAVQQWRWRSTLLNGQPVDVITEIHVNYSLTR